MNLFVVSFLLFAPPSTKDAETFVRDLLAPYATSKNVEHKVEAVYEPTLAALIKKDEQLAQGEVGALDADPICNCQDWGRFNIKSVKAVKGDGERVVVEARFVNLGHNQTSQFTVVATTAGPRVYDINLGKALPSIRTAYEADIKAYESETH